MGVPGALARELRGHAARRRRRHVPDAAAERRRRARCRRPAASSGSISTSRRPTRRPCCGSVNRGLAILGDTLFMATIDAHLIALDAKSGQPLWNIDGRPNAATGYAMTWRRSSSRTRSSSASAGGEFGIRGFVAAFDADDRQGSLAVQHDSRARRAGPRDLAGRLVEDWRRLGLADRLVRSGAQPDVLGRRQPRARLEPGAAAGRQPLLAARSSRSMPTPASSSGISSSRRTTPTTTTRCRFRCSSTSTWKARPRKLMLWANRNGFFYVLDRATGRVPLRQSVREGELGERPRRERPADPDAAAARPADVSGRSGRHELVFAVLQSAHRVCSTCRRGKTTGRFTRRCSRNTRRGGFSRADDIASPIAAQCADACHSRARRSDQHLDRRVGSRRGHRARSAHRPAEVDVSDARCHRPAAF